MPLDPAYQTVAPDECPSMLDPARDATRSPHFEEIIARTEEHFWNPEDADYIDFAAPWNAEEPILPTSFVVEAHTAVWDRLDEGQRIAFTIDPRRRSSACRWGGARWRWPRRSPGRGRGYSSG